MTTNLQDMLTTIQTEAGLSIKSKVEAPVFPAFNLTTSANITLHHRSYNVSDILMSSANTTLHHRSYDVSDTLISYSNVEYFYRVDNYIEVMDNLKSYVYLNHAMQSVIDIDNTLKSDVYITTDSTDKLPTSLVTTVESAGMASAVLREYLIQGVNAFFKYKNSAYPHRVIGYYNNEIVFGSIINNFTSGHVDILTTTANIDTNFINSVPPVIEGLNTIVGNIHLYFKSHVKTHTDTLVSDIGIRVSNISPHKITNNKLTTITTEGHTMLYHKSMEFNPGIDSEFFHIHVHTLANTTTHYIDAYVVTADLTSNLGDIRLYVKDTETPVWLDSLTSTTTLEIELNNIIDNPPIFITTSADLSMEPYLLVPPTHTDLASNSVLKMYAKDLLTGGHGATIVSDVPSIKYAAGLMVNIVDALETITSEIGFKYARNLLSIFDEHSPMISDSDILIALGINTYPTVLDTAVTEFKLSLERMDYLKDICSEVTTEIMLNHVFGNMLVTPNQHEYITTQYGFSYEQGLLTDHTVDNILTYLNNLTTFVFDTSAEVSTDLITYADLEVVRDTTIVLTDSLLTSFNIKTERNAMIDVEQTLYTSGDNCLIYGADNKLKNITDELSTESTLKHVFGNMFKIQDQVVNITTQHGFSYEQGLLVGNKVSNILTYLNNLTTFVLDTKLQVSTDLITYADLEVVRDSTIIWTENISTRFNIKTERNAIINSEQTLHTSGNNYLVYGADNKLENINDELSTEVILKHVFGKMFKIQDQVVNITTQHGFSYEQGLLVGNKVDDILTYLNNLTTFVLDTKPQVSTNLITYAGIKVVRDSTIVWTDNMSTRFNIKTERNSIINGEQTLYTSGNNYLVYGVDNKLENITSLIQSHFSIKTEKNLIVEGLLLFDIISETSLLYTYGKDLYVNNTESLNTIGDLSMVKYMLYSGVTTINTNAKVELTSLNFNATNTQTLNTLTNITAYVLDKKPTLVDPLNTVLSRIQTLYTPKVTITLDRNGGQSGTANIVFAKDIIALPKSIVPPSRSFYNFKGYYTTNVTVEKQTFQTKFDPGYTANTKRLQLDGNNTQGNPLKFLNKLYTNSINWRISMIAHSTHPITHFDISDQTITSYVTQVASATGYKYLIDAPLTHAMANYTPGGMSHEFVDFETSPDATITVSDTVAYLNTTSIIKRIDSEGNILNFDESTYTSDTTLYALYTPDKVKVVWENYAGAVIQTEWINYVGNSNATPTITYAPNGTTSTAQYTYGWPAPSYSITTDTVDLTTVTIKENRTLNSYRINWINYAGVTVKTELISYGSTSSAPVNTTTDVQYVYNWPQASVVVTGNATIYETATLRTYTITWKKHIGTIAKTETLGYGLTSTAPSGTPDTPVYDYSWPVSSVTVYGNQTITETRVNIDYLLRYLNGVTSEYGSINFEVIDPITITLNKTGGAGGTDTIVSLKGIRITPTTAAVPSWTGRTFTGYFTATSGGTKRIDNNGNYVALNNSTYLTNTTLYAQWVLITYTITYNNNNGTSNSSATYNITTNQTLAQVIGTPSKVGYVFSSWLQTSATGGGWTNGINWPSTTSLLGKYSNVSLTAQYDARTYTVTFNSNGGNAPSVSSKTVTYDSTYGALATATRSNRSFLGWFTAATGGTKVTASTVVKITANQTLYAHWNPLNASVVQVVGTEYKNITLEFAEPVYAITTSKGTGVATLTTNPVNYTQRTTDRTVNYSSTPSTGYTLNTATITRLGDYGGSTPTVVNSTTINIPANSYGPFRVNMTATLLPPPKTVAPSIVGTPSCVQIGGEKYLAVNVKNNDTVTVNIYASSANLYETLAAGASRVIDIPGYTLPGNYSLTIWAVASGKSKSDDVKSSGRIRICQML